MSSKKGGSAFVLGTLIGAAAGTALGLLYAPKKGGETRRKLAAESKKWKKRAGQILKEARQTVEETAQVVQKEVEKASSELRSQDQKPDKSAVKTNQPAIPKRRYFKRT